MEYRWHIFLANLDPVIGSEQGKTRPVLIISEEEINQIMPIVNVFYPLLLENQIGEFIQTKSLYLLDLKV